MRESAGVLQDFGNLFFDFNILVKRNIVENGWGNNWNLLDPKSMEIQVIFQEQLNM
jgi:hypothetical protein